eukprot:214030-Chlamydomonas_euryale.AAC.1
MRGEGGGWSWEPGRGKGERGKGGRGVAFSCAINGGRRKGGWLFLARVTGDGGGSGTWSAQAGAGVYVQFRWQASVRSDSLETSGRWLCGTPAGQWKEPDRGMHSSWGSVCVRAGMRAAVSSVPTMPGLRVCLECVHEQRDVAVATTLNLTPFPTP